MGTHKPIAILAETLQHGYARAMDEYADGPYVYLNSGWQIREADGHKRLVAFIATAEHHLRGREISGFWVEGNVAPDLVQFAQTRVR